MCARTVSAAHSGAVAVKRYELRHFAKARSVRLGLGEVQQALVQIHHVGIVPIRCIGVLWCHNVLNFYHVTMLSKS